MNGSMQQVVPVVISIIVIIVIAVLQGYSKPVAAITATMPLTIPLALWIVYAAEGGGAEVSSFVSSLLVGVGATLIFTLALWVAARAGLSLAGMLLAAYGVWAAALGAYYLLGRLWGE